MKMSIESLDFSSDRGAEILKLLTNNPKWNELKYTYNLFMNEGIKTKVQFVWQPIDPSIVKTVFLYSESTLIKMFCSYIFIILDTKTTCCKNEIFVRKSIWLV